MIVGTRGWMQDETEEEKEVEYNMQTGMASTDLLDSTSTIIVDNVLYIS